MNRPRRSNPRRADSIFSRRTAAWWVLGFCVWCGCTVTKENYATLSFFFDGVPDPNAVGRGTGTPGDTLAEQVVVHKPYAEEKCETCHKTQYRPSRNDPSMCLSCHTTTLDQHAWTHGAVAGGACLWCHSPHESARKWLLRSPDRKLCMQCHSATMMNGTTVPAHMDPKSGCLECHFGHGGENSLMLRAGATANAPPPESAAPEGVQVSPPDTKGVPAAAAEKPVESKPGSASPEVTAPSPPSGAVLPK